MKNKLLKPRFLTLSAFVLLAAAMRLLPHPLNVTPVAAMALFSGAYFSTRRAAFGLPLAAMVVSDLALGVFVYGFEGLFFSRLFVYGSFAAMVAIGRLVHKRKSVVTVLGGAATGSVLFFVVTNFGVWIGGSLYPMTWEGLLSCYVAAVPFFRNTLLGNLAYASFLFGSFEVAARSVPALQKAPARAQ